MRIRSHMWLDESDNNSKFEFTFGFIILDRAILITKDFAYLKLSIIGLTLNYCRAFNKTFWHHMLVIPWC